MEAAPAVHEEEKKLAATVEDDVGDVPDPDEDDLDDLDGKSAWCAYNMKSPRLTAEPRYVG